VAIDYRLGNDIALDALIDCYRDSTLGARRPIGDRDAMAQMLRHANLVVSAWDGEKLVGISRAFTDHAYVTYLSDLVVRESHQRQGIGKELIRRTQSAAPAAYIALLAAPLAVDYYEHIGFTRHTSAWVLRPGESVR
jgi:GNAT superfamily N-acetyltransferase